MSISLLIDQQEKFDGKNYSKINLYDIFSNENDIPLAAKRQIQLKGILYTWWSVGTLRREELGSIPSLDLSVLDNGGIIAIEDNSQIEQIKQLL